MARARIQWLGAWAWVTLAIAALGLGGVWPEIRALVHVLLLVGTLGAISLPDASLAQTGRVHDLVLGFGLLTGAVLVGLVPLPGPILKVVAPDVVAARPELGWWTLSLRPEATLDEAADHVAWLAVAALVGTWGAVRWRRTEAEHGVVLGVAAVVAVMAAHRLHGTTALFGVFSTSLVVPHTFYAPFVDRNHVGLAVALGAPTLLGVVARQPRSGWAALSLAALGVGGLAALEAGARSAWVGSAAAALGFAIWQRGSSGVFRIATFGGALALALGVAGLSWWMDDGGLGGRLAVWGAAVRALSGAWLAGVGGGAADAATQPHRTDTDFHAWHHLHNDPLEWLVETGLVGLVAGVAALTFLVPRPSEERARAIVFTLGVVAMLVGACVEFPLQLPGLALPAVAMLALRRTLYEARLPVDPRHTRRLLTGVLLAQILATAWTTRSALTGRASAEALAYAEDPEVASAAAGRLRWIAPWRSEIGLVEAWSARADGDAGRAAERARAVVQAHPDDADTLRKAALILARSGASEEADGALARAQSRAPFDWRNAVARAHVRAALGQDASEAWGEAFRRHAPWRYVEEAMKTVPVGLYWLDVLRDAPATYSARLGNHLVAQGDLEVAVLAYEQAAELDPGAFGGHPPHAVALLKAGEAALAERVARRALEASPSDPQRQELLGDALAAQGQWDEAAAAYLVAAEARRDARAKATRAVVRAQGVDAAARLLDRFELTGRSDPWSRLEIARARLEAGDRVGCAREVRRSGLADHPKAGRAARDLAKRCGGEL